MSLKFGIYLVEQRIISPEQFCGLVKIQQEATMSFATIAIRKNMLTIKQVAMILDIVETNLDKSFLQVALELDLIDQMDADQMLHLQQSSSPTMRRLVIECGLLTQRQTSVLYMHFEKHGATGFTQPTPVKKPSPNAQPMQPQEQTPSESMSSSKGLAINRIAKTEIPKPFHSSLAR